MLGRVVAAGDPLWLPEDSEYAQAWVEDQAARCPGGCGQYAAESMNPAHEREWHTSTVRCHACNAKASAADSFDGDRRGLLFTVGRDG